MAPAEKISVGGHVWPLSLHAPRGTLSVAVPNLIGSLESDNKMVCPITFQALPPLSKRFFGDLYQMDSSDKSEGFGKRSVWRAQLINPCRQPFINKCLTDKTNVS